MSVVLENLRRDARMRSESDREMSVAWILIPIAPYILVGLIFLPLLFAFTFPTPITSFNQTATGSNTAASSAVFAFVGFFLLVIVLFLVVGILSAVMIYKLVRRRNTHFARQILLYEDFLSMAKELASKKNVELAIPLNNLDRTIREVRTEETEKSAVLWAILAFVPIIGIFAGWYVNYFLMKDFFKHERREDGFFMDLNAALSASGVNVNLPRRMLPIPDRSFILYLILSWITGRLFDIYWVYVLITDPNNHFRQQWMIEDTIIAQVSPQLGGPSIPPPSMSPPPPGSTFTLPPSSP